MKKIINECCDCAVPAYPCIGESCFRRHVPHWYCDICEAEEEPEHLFVYDGYELCLECLILHFRTVAEREKNG